MAKKYSAAVLALPERDEDLFKEINARTAQRRREQAMAAEEARAWHMYSNGEPETVHKPLDLRRIAGTVARLLLGCVFAGAAARGWCGPEFGASGAFACIIWAAARWGRKRRG